MKVQTIVNHYLQALNLNNHPLDFKFLSDVVTRHVATFTFSSLTCQLGEDLPLDIESLYQRIIVDRRGGYCFEHNGLLFEALKALGFSPKIYLGRVIYNKDTHPALTHRISIVEYDHQQYVIDVGFGSFGPSLPVSMSGAESNDGTRTFRIKECDSGEYHMQILKDGEFFSLYRFELARYGQADCEIGHFYSHRHPKANFVNHLVASLIQEEIRSLVDLEYRCTKGGATQSLEIQTAKELERILVDKLGLKVTEDESMLLYNKLSAIKA